MFADMLRHALQPAARAVLASGLLAVTLSAAEEHDQVIPLDVLSISATRTPQDIRTLPHSVTLLDLPALADMQVVDLRTALATTPGVIVATSGGAGGATSVFMRGASSHQVSLMVDGVRMNDRTASYINFLGGADLEGLNRLEVLRGPQSTLYGSSAMGGVITLETARGSVENTGGSVTASGGSFGTWGGNISARGGIGATGYSASFSKSKTDNDRPDNAFDVRSAAARLEGRPQENLLVGATVRWQQSDLEEPGSRVFPYPGTIAFENRLVTGYGEWSAGETYRSRVTVGRHDRDYVYTDAFSATVVHNNRTIADWQNTWNATDEVEVVGGLNYELSHVRISGLRSRDELWAGYLSTTWQAREDVVINVGGRHDEFESVGGATTGRAGAAWLLDGGRTKLRATFGTGFTAPGTDDRYGVAIWGQLGNPDIQPEKSRGWDVGVDRDLRNGQVGVAATWFDNHYRDLFEYEIVDFATFEGRIVNRARASTRGAELALRWRPTATVATSLTYTWLEATNDITDARLLRRPRHTVDLDAHWRAAPAWIIGGGLHLVADRFDNTATGPAKIGDYATLRLYTSYAVRPELHVKLRIENALDEEYDEVFGYAALPRAFYGSIEWRY